MEDPKTQCNDIVTSVSIISTDNAEKTENSSKNKPANQETERDPVVGGVERKEGTVEMNLTEGGLNEDGCSWTEKEPQITSF